MDFNVPMHTLFISTLFFTQQWALPIVFSCKKQIFYAAWYCKVNYYFFNHIIL